MRVRQLEIQNRRRSSQGISPWNRRQDGAGEGGQDEEGTGTGQDAGQMGQEHTETGAEQEHRYAGNKVGEEREQKQRTATGNKRLESSMGYVPAGHNRQSGN